MAKKKKLRPLPAVSYGVKSGILEMFGALMSICTWTDLHKKWTVFLMFATACVSLLEFEGGGEYYFRTRAETNYLDGLRKKYSGYSNALSVKDSEIAAAKACAFLSGAGGKDFAKYDSDSARTLLLGTGLAETDLRPRFQDSGGDAIGLYQIEYGTYRDLLNRVLKERNPALYRAIVKEFAANSGDVKFEMLQTDHALAGIFALLKYHQSGKALPPADDYDALGDYHKRYYNTHKGRANPRVFSEKLEASKPRTASAISAHNSDIGDDRDGG